MKIVNIDGENLQIFWMTWENSMKFSGNMWLIILKRTKNQGFTLFLEDIFWVKPNLGVGSQIGPSSILRVNRKLNNVCIGLALKSFDRCIGKTNDKICYMDLSLCLTRDKFFNFHVGRRVLRYRNNTNKCLVSVLIGEYIFCRCSCMDFSSQNT